jgi:general stress protein CsbA
LGGGDWLKFSDVIVASASLVLTGIMLETVLRVAFIPAGSTLAGEMLAWIISLLVTSLIVGYLFALRIQEQSRIKAIGKILVLSTLAVLLITMAWYAQPEANAYHKDNMVSLFNTTGFTNSDWYAYSAFLTTMDMVIVVVFNFIGLYVGSMLKKPKKT